MANKNIKTEIKIRNLAPISNLNKEINSKQLEFSIFANNGQGKTFISNMFRLLEKDTEIITQKSLNKFISFGENACEFSFKITDNQGVKEKFRLKIEKNKFPSIPNTYYIYHVFNQDYINKNSQANYDKDGNITDFIIGKANIDISKEESLLKLKEKELDNKQIEVDKKIDADINNNIVSIPHIKRYSEYKNYLNFNSLYNNYKNLLNVPKSYKDYLNDFNKIKSVPEDIKDIDYVKKINDDIEFLNSTIKELKKEFSLSKIADDFKTKILRKKGFIEQGLQLRDDKKTCPFCEQKLGNDALKLIDEYTLFIENKENTIIKSFENNKQKINNLIQELKKCETSNLQSKSKYNDYVRKYLSYIFDEFIEIEISQLIAELNNINNQIDEKLNHYGLKVHRLGKD